jgi:hypothetical protein
MSKELGWSPATPEATEQIWGKSVFVQIAKGEEFVRPLGKGESLDQAVTDFIKSYPWRDAGADLGRDAGDRPVVHGQIIDAGKPKHVIEHSVWIVRQDKTLDIQQAWVDIHAAKQRERDYGEDWGL